MIPYYKPLIDPSVELTRHYFWSNLSIPVIVYPMIDISRSTSIQISEYLGIPIPNCRKSRLVLRNCVKPEVSAHILSIAILSHSESI